MLRGHLLHFPRIPRGECDMTLNLLNIERVKKFKILTNQMTLQKPSHNKLVSRELNDEKVKTQCIIPI